MVRVRFWSANVKQEILKREGEISSHAALTSINDLHHCCRRIEIVKPGFRHITQSPKDGAKWKEIKELNW